MNLLTDRVNFEITRQKPISLELLVVRDITEYFSRQRHYDPQKGTTATVLIKNTNSLTLGPVPNVPQDVITYGYYGIAADDRGHIWFSSNWDPGIYEVDKNFTFVNRYPSGPISNFREIQFHDEKAYILDEGLPNKGALHIFSYPEFHHEKTIPLDIPPSHIPTHLCFIGNKIVIGSPPSSNSGWSEEYYITTIGQGISRQTKMWGLVSLFEHNDTLYGYTDVRGEKGEKNPYGRQYILSFNDALISQDPVPLISPMFTRVSDEPFVDNRGTLFRREITENFIPSFAFFDLSGRLLQTEKTPFNFADLCFDKENVLTAVINYKEHLLGVRYRIHYNQDS